VVTAHQDHVRQRDTVPSTSRLTDARTRASYALSLPDALPIYAGGAAGAHGPDPGARAPARGAGHGALALPDRAEHRGRHRARALDRKSTRLNSSHLGISYAVFCLKKKRTHPHAWLRNLLVCAP